jgi:hypothetical protein
LIELSWWVATNPDVALAVLIGVVLWSYLTLFWGRDYERRHHHEEADTEVTDSEAGRRRDMRHARRVRRMGGGR